MTNELFCQWGFVFCPEELLKTEETFDVRDDCLALFKENNFTNKHLGSDGMITVLSNSKSLKHLFTQIR